MKNEKIKLALICGGESPESDISILSAKNILNKINCSRYEIIQIGITKEGKWIFSEDVVASLNGEKKYHDIIFNYILT